MTSKCLKPCPQQVPRSRDFCPAHEVLVPRSLVAKLTRHRSLNAELYRSYFREALKYVRGHGTWKPVSREAA